jgi:hypothetical protein
MKGGAAPARTATAGKPPVAKSSAPKSGPAESAGKTSPAADKLDKPAKASAAAPADDDPFAVDQSATASATPVSAKPAPGKTLEVTCPMCETKGFVSPKFAGKLVKCCNPQCMVPVFTAPKIEKPVVVAPPPAPKKSLPWMYIIGGLCAVAIAATCIVVMNRPGVTEIPPPEFPAWQTTKKDQAPEDANLAKAKNSDQAKAKLNGEDKGGAQTATPEEGPAFVENTLQRIVDAGQNMPNNRKPLWLRLLSTAYVHAGELKQARERLDLIERPGAPSPYEAVLPWVAVAWQQAESPAEFKQSVDHIQRLAGTLPPRGRYATEAAIAAAPLLVVAGKTAEAHALVAGHHSDHGVEQLAASLRIVIDDGSFDLDAPMPGRTFGDWQAPLETAVTLILAAHGKWDDALAWASAATDLAAKTEASIVWSEVFARRAVPAEDAAGFERARKVAEGLSPQGRPRLLARLAAVKLSQGDRASAESLLAEAQSLMAGFKVPEPVKVSGAKPLIALKLTDPVPLRQAALAAAEIAGVQAQLNQTTAAWDNVLLAIRFLQGIGPSMSSILERMTQLEREPSRLQNELNSEMGLKKEAEKRSAFNRYRERLKGDVEKATEMRYVWELAVLEAAARFGLLDQVWDELQVLDRKQNANEREPVLTSAVPLIVAARYAALGNEKKRDEIHKAVASTVNGNDPRAAEAYAESRFAAGDYSGAIGRLNEGMTAAGTLHESTLKMACRLVANGKITEAIAFCNGIRDSALREEGLWLTAAMAARSGRAAAFARASSGLATMESAAANAGLVAGLKAPLLLKEGEKK